MSSTPSLGLPARRAVFEEACLAVASHSGVAAEVIKADIVNGQALDSASETIFGGIIGMNERR